MTNTRAKERDIFTWGPHGGDLDLQLLLAVWSTCKIERIPVPWEKVAKQFAEYLTGPAIEQHLSKIRIARINEGKPLPELVARGGRKSASHPLDPRIIVLEPRKSKLGTFEGSRKRAINTDTEITEADGELDFDVPDHEVSFLEGSSQKEPKRRISKKTKMEIEDFEDGSYSKQKVQGKLKTSSQLLTPQKTFSQFNSKEEGESSNPRSMSDASVVQSKLNKGSSTPMRRRVLDPKLSRNSAKKARKQESDLDSDELEGIEYAGSESPTDTFPIASEDVSDADCDADWDDEIGNTLTPHVGAGASYLQLAVTNHSKEKVSSEFNADDGFDFRKPKYHNSKQYGAGKTKQGSYFITLRMNPDRLKLLLFNISSMEGRLSVPSHPYDVIHGSTGNLPAHAANIAADRTSAVGFFNQSNVDPNLPSQGFLQMTNTDPLVASAPFSDVPLNPFNQYPREDYSTLYSDNNFGRFQPYYGEELELEPVHTPDFEFFNDPPEGQSSNVQANDSHLPLSMPYSTAEDVAYPQDSENAAADSVPHELEDSPGQVIEEFMKSLYDEEGVKLSTDNFTGEERLGFESGSGNQYTTIGNADSGAATNEEFSMETIFGTDANDKVDHNGDNSEGSGRYFFL